MVKKMTEVLLKTTDLTLTINNNYFCKNLNFALNPGEIWGILGPNGCGKSLLLHALAGLDSIHNGEVWLANKNIFKYSPKRKAQLLGILFQETISDFSQTVMELCLTGRFPHLSFFSSENDVDVEIVRKALAIVELDNKLNQKVKHLSGGELRRVAIAILLAQSPLIYLLDEPENHLDIYFQHKILKHFKTLKKQGVIMSLHDVNLAETFCTHLIMFLDGGNILTGTANSLLNTENISKLYQVPFKQAEIKDRRFWLPSL